MFCYVLFLLGEKVYKKLLCDIPPNAHCEDIGGSNVCLFPWHEPVTPPELGEYRLVILWRNLRKLMKALHSRGWDVIARTNDVEFQLIGDSVNYDRYLDVIEEEVSKRITWPISYPDIAHHLIVTFRPSGRRDYCIKVVRASVLCASSLDSEYLREFLEELIKTLS